MLHRMDVKPRALRSKHATNGGVSSQDTSKKQETGEVGGKDKGMSPPPPVRKSNADFRAMLSKKQK